MEVGGGGGGGGGGGCKVIANVYSQVEFLDNWFRRHPLKNTNSLFSFEFCLATTFTNLFFYLFFFVLIIHWLLFGG